MEQKFIAGAYIRLSKQDKEKDVSNSIENQISLINNYLNDNQEIKSYKYYIDDGYSGTNFDRPSFLDMIQDIHDRKINTIILKYLSRFGRNHVESSQYLEIEFPLLNIRVIFINENIDNINELDTNEFTKIALLNLVYDEHIRDISKKTRSTLKTKRNNGLYVGGLTPYGYKKDEDNKYIIKIDIEPAKVVKQIFDLALNGKSKQEIVIYLNKNKIPTPSQYRNNVKENKRYIADKWNIESIDLILKNKMYIGDLIQGKTRTASYRVHKRILNIEDNISIKENNHKSIINKEKFNLVNNIMYNRSRKVQKDLTFDIFSGFLKYNDCKENMILKKYTKNNKTYHYYDCFTYYRKKECSSKRINNSKLVEKTIKVLNENNIMTNKISHKYIIKYIDDIFVKENNEIDIKLKSSLDVK